MASTKDYLNYVLDLLKDINNLSYKKMMGEYILYKDGIIFGGIYDDRLLIKKNSLPNDFKLNEEIPYLGAKPMCLIDIDDRELLDNIIEIINKL